MRELKALAAGSVGIWLGCKALGLAEAGMTRLLMAMGLDWGRAAARAPLVLGVVVGSIGLLAIWVWTVIEEERSRKRLRKAHRSHARNPEYPALPEHTEREA